MLFHKPIILLLSAVLISSAAPPLLPQSPIILGSAAGLGPQVDSADSPILCTAFRELYGSGRWTYVEARWCIKQTDTSTTISQQLRNPWYYWGLAWYRGGNRRLSWATKGLVGVGGVDRDFDNTGGSDGAGIAVIATLEPKLSAGDCNLILDFHLEGPYWGSDAAIDAHVEASGLHLD